MGDDTIRTAVVTGANSGIGLETARGVAAAGLRTVLLCRNAERAEAARADIAASVPGAELDVVLADLGSQAQVRRAAAELGSRYDALHVLVNNAGVILKSKQQARTDEGHDAYLATNHLGPSSSPTSCCRSSSAAHPVGSSRSPRRRRSTPACTSTTSSASGGATAPTAWAATPRRSS